MKLSPLSQTGDTLDGIFFRFGANFLAGKKKKTDERTEGREKQLRRKFQLLLLKRQQQQKNSNKVKASKGTPAEPPNLTLFPRCFLGLSPKRTFPLGTFILFLSVCFCCRPRSVDILHIHTHTYSDAVFGLTF